MIRAFPAAYALLIGFTLIYLALLLIAAVTR